MTTRHALDRLRGEQAQALASAILDARLRHERGTWSSWLTHARAEAAPLIQAVRVLAHRQLESANGASRKELEHVNVNDNGHELAKAPARGPRIGRSPGLGDAQVRGLLAERVIVSTELDPFLSLAALATYAGLSVRNLRERLLDPTHPLPCYRVGGKVLVRRSDYDAWALRHRRVGAGADVDRLVAEVLRELR